MAGPSCSRWPPPPAQRPASPKQQERQRKPADENATLARRRRESRGPWAAPNTSAIRSVGTEGTSLGLAASRVRQWGTAGSMSLRSAPAAGGLLALGRLLQKCNQVPPILGLRRSKAHIVARYHDVRVGQPPLQHLRIPDPFRVPKTFRVLKPRHAARLAPIDIPQPRPFAIRIQRMAPRTAMLEHKLAARRIARPF